MKATLCFKPDGTGACLYTELVDLHSLGRLDISRATNIEFNNQTQQWEVKDQRGKARFFARSRATCLQWEHEHLNP